MWYIFIFFLSPYVYSYSAHHTQHTSKKLSRFRTHTQHTSPNMSESENTCPNTIATVEHTQPTPTHTKVQPTPHTQIHTQIQHTPHTLTLIDDKIPAEVRALMVEYFGAHELATLRFVNSHTNTYINAQQQMWFEKCLHTFLLRIPQFLKLKIENVINWASVYNAVRNACW